MNLDTGDDEYIGLDWEVDDRIHIIPMFGKPHDSTAECWCHPVQDEEEPLLFIHKVMQ